jgi:predicted transcriptional regulator
MSASDPKFASEAEPDRSRARAFEVRNARVRLGADEVFNQTTNETAQVKMRAMAREVHSGRRSRDRVLGPDMSAEASWDMLLELYASEGEGRPMPLADLCLASAVPSATALRHIKLLTEAGLICHEASNPNAFVLTEKGRSRLDLLFGKYLSADTSR